MVKIGNTLLCDPSVEEEQMAEARITVSTTEDGHIRAMQKGKIGSLSIDEIKNAISISLKVGSALRETYIR